MSVEHDSGELVRLYVREERSDHVARLVANRAEAIIVNGLHALAVGDALRPKRFREEIDDEQLSASMSMVTGDLASGRLIRSGVDWQSVYVEAERLSVAATTEVGVRTIDLVHVAAALVRGASWLVSLDRRQRAAAGLAGLAMTAWCLRRVNQGETAIAGLAPRIRVPVGPNGSRN